MPLEVTTNVQLKSLMVKIVTDVINEVSDQVLKDFKTDYIDKYVYGWGVPTVYDRTYEFRDQAWEWDKMKQSVNEVTRKLYFDGSKMDTNQPGLYRAEKGLMIGKHGSLISGWDSDAREHMAGILDQAGPTSTLTRFGDPFEFVSPRRAESYWQMFIIEYVNGNKLKSLLDKTFAKYGIKSG